MQSIILKKKLKAKAIKIAIGITSIVLFFLIWHFSALQSEVAYLPTPYEVGKALLNSFYKKDFTGHYMQEHVFASITKVFYAFLITISLAIPIGLLIGYSKYIEMALSPIIEIFRPIPPIAWLPFAIFFFVSPFDVVYIISFGMFFPLLLNTIHGVKGVDKNLIDAGRTLGAKKLQIFKKVILPSSLPSIITGIKIGLGVGWMTIIAAEMVGVAEGGLGYYIWAMAEVGLFDNMFAGMVAIATIGYAMSFSIEIIEKRLRKWFL